MKIPLLTNSIFSFLSLFNNNKNGFPDNEKSLGNIPSLIPRKTLFSPEEYTGGVSLSPDGKWLSWIAPIGTVANIWVKELPDGVAHNLTYDTGRGINGASWTYDNRTLLYSQDQDGDENWRLYTLDVYTGKVRLVTDTANVTASILASSVKFPDQLIIGLNNRDPTYHDAYYLNITTGDKKLLFQNDYFSGYTFDDNMNLRMLVNQTDEGGRNYYLYENETLTLYRTVAFEDSENIYPWGFDKSGENMYWTDGQDDDLGSFYEVKIKTGEKILIYKSTSAAITGVTFHPVTVKPISVTVDYAKPKRILLDKSYTKEFQLLKKLMPDNSDPWIISNSLDFETWLVSPDTDVGPSSYFFYNRSNPDKNLTFMFYSQKSLLNYTFAPMHSVEVPISDGMKEVCYLTLPVESDPASTGLPMSPLPTILNVHGGPWARDSWGFGYEVQYFANRGYAVFQCNFRSSTGFGKRFSNAGNGQWGKKMQQDLTDAVHWAVKNKIADEKRVAIYGGSYGGYAVLAGLTFTPDLYACGVDIVGPSNLVTLMKSVPPYWKPAFNQMKIRIGGDPETPEGRKFLESVSPLFFANKIKKPLLIGQGANDPRVHQNESDQIVEALKSSKVSVTYMLFPNEGHGFARPENNLAFYAVTEQFLKKCLGGRAEPIGDEVSKSPVQMKTFANGILNVPY